MAATVVLACVLFAAPQSTVPANATIAHESAASAPADSFETFLNRLMGAESAGHTRAKNPRSSALGTFQFIKGTFLEVARRHFPKEVEGFVEDKILALRADPDFARRAAAAFCRDNIVRLQAQGLEPTFADLRLAFLLGPSDAARVLKAESQTPAVQLLSAAVIKANPFMRGMTVADLRAKSIRDVERDRQEMIAVAPQPRERPSARPRPTGRETLPTKVARIENCKLLPAANSPACRRGRRQADLAGKLDVHVSRPRSHERG